MRRPPIHRIVIAFDWPEFVNTLRDTYMTCSQEEMARQLGVTVSTISNWERGVAKPQWRHQRKLRALGYDYKYRRQQWPSRSWVEQWSTDE